jgi:hypothetical protein
MTSQQASIFQPQVLDQLKYILQNKQYKELFISVGKDYAAAVAGYEQLMPSRTHVTVPVGPRGRKQAEWYDWLYRETPPLALSVQRGIPRYLVVEIG